MRGVSGSPRSSVHSRGDKAHEREVAPIALDLLRWNLSVVGHLCQQIAPQSVKRGVLLFS